VTPAAPPPLVAVQPTREIRIAAPVNQLALDGGRVATLVGTVQAWEYVLVWSPKGIVLRASLNCDTQETNVTLASGRFAHLCYQGTSYVVTGTMQPLRARVALQVPGSPVISLAGQGPTVAGSVSLPGASPHSVIWRFDERRRTKLRTYTSRAVLVNVDRDRLLVDTTKALDVLTRKGSLVSTLRRAHDGGAIMRGGRVATISRGRLTVSTIRGKPLVARSVPASAHLEDLDQGLVLYSVETRLHLLRLADGKDVKLRFRSQFGYVAARLSRGALFYAYNGSSAVAGRVGFVAASGVRRLLAGR
jgi:hypothetical protein